MKKDLSHLQKLCQLIRYDIITSTTHAGSGHPTTSLSATELMTSLFFGGFLKYDLKNHQSPYNDRVIFSKGHASPLLYALYHAAGVLSYEDLLTLRKFGSVIEGHPTPDFKYVDVATGSLGQGLSIGLGMALGIKSMFAKITSKRLPNVYVLLGDSEIAEGQVWEALQLGNYYKLNNLVGILDVNRLGQRGETMLGWDTKTYQKRIESFGWETILIDGHDLNQVHNAFQNIVGNDRGDKPKMIIAKTVKGKGISFLENKDGWHGKAVPKDMLETALKEIGKVDQKLRGKIQSPKPSKSVRTTLQKNPTLPQYPKNSLVATRSAYGDALVALGAVEPRLVVLDAETSNSTYAEKFKKVYPERFFEMFIAEQNMASAALGFAKLGFIPYFSSFAAFLTRSFDQIRIAQYSKPNIKIVGSHAGVSIGQDGSSQMGLEDIAMAQSILESIVLSPSDAVSTFKLAKIMLSCQGTIYLRLTRSETPVIYSTQDEFEIGGSKVLYKSNRDKAVVIATGITLHEAVKAYDVLKRKGTKIAVIDAYSIKPIDKKTIIRYAKKTGHVIIVEDHYTFGGLGAAVKDALSGYKTKITHLSVNKIPHSGTPQELLHYEEIDADAIVKAVKPSFQVSPLMPTITLNKVTLNLTK